jgi:hypothetical protein
MTTSRLIAIGLIALLAGVVPGTAQTTPAATPATPADTPSIKVGVLIFADYTIQQQPKMEDANGNDVTFNAFQLARSYINVTGNVTKNISFRVTPDIARESGVGSSLNGSYTFRLKYAYAQWNLEDHLSKGSYARFGMQQTPWIDFIDSVYRYRFQGPTFEDREGFLPSADVGASFHYSLPKDFGDVHAAVFNGETYSRAEVNDQKGLQVRGTIRPAPSQPVLRGLRLTGFWDKDAYVKSAERQRAIFGVTFEHPHLHAGFNYLAATDQTTVKDSVLKRRGWSLFVTPRTSKGWEGLLRLDHLEPNTAASDQTKQRTIAGLAYWFANQGGVSSALLFDVDQVKFDGFSPVKPTDRKIAIHALVSF